MTNKPPLTTMIALRIDQELAETLRDHAVRHNATQSEFLRGLLKLLLPAEHPLNLSFAQHLLVAETLSEANDSVGQLIHVLQPAYGVNDEAVKAVLRIVQSEHSQLLALRSILDSKCKREHGVSPYFAREEGTT